MPPKERASARRWVFTLNSVPIADAKGIAEQMFKSGQVQYLLCQLEKGEQSGVLHLQGCFTTKTKDPVRMADIKAWGGPWTRAHLDQARAWEKAKLYCQKEDTREQGPWEWGKEKGQGHRSDLDELAATVLQPTKRMRELAMENPGMWVRHAKGLLNLRAMTMRPYEGERRCALFWGETGTGKTRSVMDTFGSSNVYSVFDTRTPWFDGYDGERTVLFDEMGPGCIDINMLKQMTDRYAIQVPVKGGSQAYMAETVVLTSNTHWTLWYPKGVERDFQALARRIKVFHFPTEREQAFRWLNEDPKKLGNPEAPYRVDETESDTDQRTEIDTWEALHRENAVREVIDLSQ